MSIKARRGLLLVALMVAVSALVLSVGMSFPAQAQTASAPTPAPISGRIAVKATFLHADSADATDPPRIVDLSAAGYQPGDTLRISYDVPPSSFSYYGCQGPFVGAQGVLLLGVFSSSNQLLASSARARVPGAIDAGQDVNTGPTYRNNAPVDIPEDFRVTPPSEFDIRIPPGATHLFLGVWDSYYSDNCGTGATFDVETPPDTTPPVLSLPDDMTVEATGPVGAQVTYDASANDAVDGNVSVDCTPASGSTFPLDDTTTVECSATDEAGNTASDSFTVTVQDTTAPSLSVPSNMMVVEATDASGAEVNFTDEVSASDTVDPNPSIDCTPASGTTFALDTTQVNCTATDAAGNVSAPKTFDVKVQDTTAPVIASHDDVTEEATGPDGANVDYTSPETTDAVAGNGTANCTPASGSNFPMGPTTVTCTAQDAAGNQATPSTFQVTVEDTTPPTLDLPDDITEDATGPNGKMVTYDATASDLVDGSVDVDCSPASGSMFPIGTTTVDCSATDVAGNESTGSFTVKVQDTVAPTDIQFLGNINDGDSFFFGDVPAEPTCTATDGGSGLQSCVVSGFSTDVGTHTLTATATDEAGNTVTRQITYTVKAWTFKGFYQPVDMNGVYNTVKGGSTVPIKFEIFEGTTELTDTAYIKLPLQATKISCTTGVAEDLIELTATGATSLRYDTTGGQFIYNWKTPTGAGSCYKVTITANDGSSQTAFFKLK